MPRINLQKVLTKRKLSKRQFAKRLGISYHNVFRLFSDDANPTFRTMCRWAEVLDCKVRDLFEE